MRLAVIGSRTFTDYWKLEEVLSRVQTPITHIVSGGAKGADELAQKYAMQHGLPITIFYPNREKYGKAAYARRNQQIVGSCDNMVAFWMRGSPGTKMAIEMAEEAGKKVFVVMALDKEEVK